MRVSRAGPRVNAAVARVQVLAFANLRACQRVGTSACHFHSVIEMARPSRSAAMSQKIARATGQPPPDAARRREQNGLEVRAQDDEGKWNLTHGQATAVITGVQRSSRRSTRSAVDSEPYSIATAGPRPSGTGRRAWMLMTPKRPVLVSISAPM